MKNDFTPEIQQRVEKNIILFYLWCNVFRYEPYEKMFSSLSAAAAAAV